MREGLGFLGRWGRSLVCHMPPTPLRCFFDFLVYPMDNIGHVTSHPRSTYHICRVLDVFNGSAGFGRYVQSPTPSCTSWWPLYRPLIPFKLTMYEGIWCMTKCNRVRRCRGDRLGPWWAICPPFPLRCFLTFWHVLWACCFSFWVYISYISYMWSPICIPEARWAITLWPIDHLPLPPPTHLYCIAGLPMHIYHLPTPLHLHYLPYSLLDICILSIPP